MKTSPDKEGWRASDAARTRFVLLTRMTIAMSNLVDLRGGAERAGMKDAARAFDIAAHTVAEQAEAARAQQFRVEGGEAWLPPTPEQFASPEAQLADLPRLLDGAEDLVALIREALHPEIRPSVGHFRAALAHGQLDRVAYASRLYMTCAAERDQAQAQADQQAMAGARHAQQLEDLRNSLPKGKARDGIDHILAHWGEPLIKEQT